MYSYPVHIIDRHEPWIDPNAAAVLGGGVGGMPVIYLDAMEMWYPKSVVTRTRPDGTTYRELDPNAFAFDFNIHMADNFVMEDPDIYGGDCWCGKWKCPGCGSEAWDDVWGDSGRESGLGESMPWHSDMSSAMADTVELMGQPNTWIVKKCSPGTPPGATDTYVWEHEDRLQRYRPQGNQARFNNPNDATVRINVGGGRCSGVRVWDGDSKLEVDTWVLTAAHCLVDNDGLRYREPEEVKITDVFGETLRASIVRIAPGFDSTRTAPIWWENDWALVCIDGQFSHGVAQLALGSTSNGASVIIPQFPGTTLDDQERFCRQHGRAQYTSSAHIVRVDASALYFLGDFSRGSSGAPLVDNGRIAGLVAAFRTPHQVGVGPVTANFEAFIRPFISRRCKELT